MVSTTISRFCLNTLYSNTICIFVFGYSSPQLQPGQRATSSRHAFSDCVQWWISLTYSSLKIKISWYATQVSRQSKHFNCRNQGGPASGSSWHCRKVQAKCRPGSDISSEPAYTQKSRVIRSRSLAFTQIGHVGTHQRELCAWRIWLKWHNFNLCNGHKS